MRKVYIGKVTNVYRPISCVAVRLVPEVEGDDNFDIMTGEHVLFEKGDQDKPDVTGFHSSHHFIMNIQIDKRDSEVAYSGDHCAFKLSGDKLPPNNANVFLVLAN
jgi:hypothetical protein